MKKARISHTDEIVWADDLIKQFPDYDKMIFLCIDRNCSVRMAPACIKKNDHRKPHFKKYRNQDHIKSCEYAILYQLYQKGKTQHLSKTEIKKIGYPSVFILEESEPQVVTGSKPDSVNLDEGVTGRVNEALVLK